MHLNTLMYTSLPTNPSVTLSRYVNIKIKSSLLSINPKPKGTTSTVYEALWSDYLFIRSYLRRSNDGPWVYSIGFLNNKHISSHVLQCTLKLGGHYESDNTLQGFQLTGSQSTVPC